MFSLGIAGARTRALLVLLALTPLGVACGPSHRLGEYDFRDKLLATEVDAPPYPEIVTGPVVVDPPKGEGAVRAVLEAGSRVAREVAVRSVQDKLEKASDRVDMAAVMENDALTRATRILRADAGTSSSADFLLDIIVDRYGIEAKNWDASAYYFIHARAILVDRSSQRRIWDIKLKATSPIGSEVYGHDVVRNVVTAAAIADLSEDDMARALQQLSEFSAAQITNRLREDLLDSRD
jgi:hypothetical protein